MGIDGIGKGRGPSASGIGTDVPGVREIAKGTETGEAFKVSKGAAIEAAPTSLERLRAGEISMQQYVDLKVDEATLHLDGKLSAEQLEFVKNSLREQLTADPVLSELVRSATGALPPARE
jgi:hypothetical protein